MVDLFREIFLWRTPESQGKDRTGRGPGRCDVSMSCHFPLPRVESQKLVSAGFTKGSLPWLVVRLVAPGLAAAGVSGGEYEVPRMIVAVRPHLNFVPEVQ